MAKIGVLAVQGDFAKHIEALLRAGVSQEDILEVRTKAQLDQVDGLIIPGGESTTVGLLLQRFGLGPEIQRRVDAGMPIWGTCMGMIMLAHEVVGHNQFSLDKLDISVQRNAYGAQVNSFEDMLDVSVLDEPILGVFIRAPIVTRVGEGVEVLCQYQDAVVAVRQGNRIGTSFHPELTEDARMHRWFADLVQAEKSPAL